MRLSKRRLLSGDILRAAAGVRGEGGDNVEGVQIAATLTNPEGQTRNIPFSMQADRAQFNGSVEPEFITAGGVYRLEVVMSKNGAELGRESQEFDVIDIDSETVVPVADTSLIQQLADATQAAGGRVWTPQQVALLAESLLQSTEKLEIKIPQLWRLGDTAADAYAFVLCLFVVMMLQWGLRKYWGLV
jgi:outer membrane usher protein FimD/PapC